MCILFFFFKQKTAYEISACLVGSEMCIRDSFATVRADVPDGAELTVGCNDSPAVVVNKVFC